MNLHEYQGKNLLNDFNVSIQRGYVADSPKEAVECAKKLSDETGTSIFVIKAQIHAGGQAAEAAREQARLSNEATDRQYEYDLELYKLNQEKIEADREQAVDNILLQAENENRRADFQDASNLRNYQYQLQIRNREQESLDQQYLKSDVL